MFGTFFRKRPMVKCSSSNLQAKIRILLSDAICQFQYNAAAGNLMRKGIVN
jgi:hypothetical protein